MYIYNKDDELKNELKYRLIFWYKDHYLGNDNTLKRHLEIFEEHYDVRLFDNKETQKDDIIKFMTFLQNELNKEGIE